MAAFTAPLINAVIETTNRCNLRCRHCGSDSGAARPGELGTARMLDLVRELRDLGCEEITLLGGEIFLDPSWYDIARQVNKSGIRLILITNGLLIDDERYKLLQSLDVHLIGVSIDGSSPMKYRRIRGVDGFQKVLEILQRLAGDPLFPHVNAITTFTRENLPWWDEFAALFDGSGITWQVQLANKAGTRFDDEFFITRRDYAWFVDKAVSTLDRRPGLQLRFMDDFGYFPLSPELAFLHETWDGCIAGRELVGIRSDGLVCACLSLGERFMEADLKTETMTAIWRSDKYFRAFRTREKHLLGACADCEYGIRCRAGCATIALSATGTLGENPYCIRLIEQERLSAQLWG